MAVDDYTVEMRLNSPFAPMLSLLAHHVEWLPDRHVEVIRRPFTWGVAFFNNREGKMTNQTLRQAVNAALDREGRLIAGADQYNQADPERARQLAEEAGYDGERDIFVTHHGFVPDPVLLNTLSATYAGWWDEENRHELARRLDTATDPEERQAAWGDTLEHMWDYLPSTMIGEWYGLASKSPDFDAAEAATQGIPAYGNSSRSQ